MPNTIRIKTTPNGSDKYLKVKLEQDFDFIEILSLKISQEDAYRKFCSDYGTIVGRVIINNGFGVPNAKVSVFIPLDDVDKNNPLIKGLYPYEVITDKDDDGVRYNLLPKESASDNECFTPVGTFPTKREVLDNDTLMEIYCKYYKFTTTTNHAGDFMIFGVPLGTYTVHVDADISDIGMASQRPYDFISQGTPQKLFQSPTKFKSDKNLNKLIQVKTLNAGVNIQPFWGDPENCEVGITRLDFDLNTSIRPSAIFVGSIFGDQHKHSINKRCRPRKKLGEMCEQVTGPGSVDMIRKTIEGNVEEFSVDGGRVIDDDGTWAFQVPMNLDYMVTAEDGSLILSQDPNRGVPTRARVRFNIGMDETGGEGRLRTRARYLVPHNPQSVGEIDYAFDETTKETSFKDLYWNKIYSVSNFISRFQRNTIFDKVVPSKTRHMTGIKNVDACAGDKTPFPYNRVNTEISPIFFIICLIMKVVIFLIYIMNKIIIPLINVVINIINSVLGVICGAVNWAIGIINGAIDILGGSEINTINCPTINHISCVYITCDDDNNKVYAPGCSKGGLDGGDAWDATSPSPDYYDGDPSGHSGPNDTGLDKCIAFQIAKALNLFQYDFYNDWVNGTLFGFLLKYKKKKKKREVFCEYECEGSGTFTAQDGVDGNGNGVGDNSCHDNILLDTSFRNSSADISIGLPPPPYETGLDTQWVNPQTSSNIREGLIKKVGNEFFYAATTHDNAYKLFATDIIDLGSIFDCDWQGIPKIQQYLIPTTYKLPPDTPEVNETTGDVETSGVISIGGNTKGLFFNINCLGLHVNNRQELNIKHISEFGVELDEAIEDVNTGAILVAADAIMGVDDIDDDRGKWFRDVFMTLNSGVTTPVSVGVGNLSSNFNTSTQADYDYTSASANGQDYVNFRGIANDSSYQQSNHSYYFYFGILPGKTSLDKMNQRFFTQCTPTTREDIIIQSSATTATGSTGSITFSFLGGTGPFTWTVTGVVVGPSTYGPTTGIGNGPNTITGLEAGTYTVVGVDTLGNQVTTTIIVPSNPPLSCSVAVSHNATSSISNDGAITIYSIIGGTPPYSYKCETFAGSLLYGPSIPITSLPVVISPVPVDNVNGHKITIFDSASNTCVTNNLTVGGPSALLITETHTNIQCYGNNTGTIALSITGGQAPLTITTTGPGGYISGAVNLAGLVYGTYTTTVIDSNSVSTSISTTLTQPAAPLTILSPIASELAMQCDPNYYYIPFYIAASSLVPSSAGVTVEYNIDGTTWVSTAMTYTNQTTPLIITKPAAAISHNIKIRFKYNGCMSNELTIQKTSIELPPTLLTLAFAGQSNNCSPHQSKFYVALSHTSRAPYTIDYTVGTLTGSVNVSSSPALVTINSVPSSNYEPNNITATLTVTDSVGCVSPAIILTSPAMIQKVPATALSCSISTSGPVGGMYTHVVSGTGGISPYTGTGSFIDSNTTYTATITDTNGCTATATG